MGRIRTIKPEFFTSEDIVSLSPLARLLYIALWCEADREGRMAWKPRTFKMRYLPGDKCDIESLCNEILGLKLIVLYGNGYAMVPAFHAHQHINPREQASQLPGPEVNASSTRAPRVSTRADLDIHAQVGREGKGKEGDTRDESRDDLPAGFADFWKTWPKTDRKQAQGKCLDAWKKAHGERDAAVILAHVEFLKSSAGWLKNGGEFIPAPLVYLNGKKWEGAELDTAGSSQWAGAVN